jgi:hypothetical protein
MAWNKQKSNPFMFRTPYPRYVIQYRKYEIIAKPTDFAEHKVDERVTILRLSEKESWTWKDLTEFNTEEWVIAPVSFYDDIANEEE